MPLPPSQPMKNPRHSMNKEPSTPRSKDQSRMRHSTAAPLTCHDPHGSISWAPRSSSIDSPSASSSVERIRKPKANPFVQQKQQKQHSTHRHRTRMTIVGAGIIGLAIAYLLARVSLFDSFPRYLLYHKREFLLFTIFWFMYVFLLFLGLTLRGI